MPAIASEASASAGLTAGLAWLALLHAAWLGTAAAAGAALLFQARPGMSHRARHAALLALLGLVAIGPPALALAQRCAADRGFAAGVPAGAWASVVVAEGPGLGLAGDPPRPADPRPGSRFDGPAARLARGLGWVKAAARAVRPVALGLWSVVAPGLAAVLALGAWRVGRLCREAADAPPDVRQKAGALGRRLGLRSVPAVRVHPAVGGPLLCGLARPVVLLPSGWLASARPGAVEAVLAHELAHARRRDHAVNLAQRALEVALLFHPGVLWLSRSLRRQREFCADALAVRLTGDPLALARALESVARSRVRPARPRHVGAALLGESSSLLPRIEELIGMTPLTPRPRLRFWPLAALPLALAFAAGTASLGRAGDEPAPAAKPAVAPMLTPPVGNFPEPGTIIGTSKLPTPFPGINMGWQIAYETRFLEVEADGWRQHLGAKLRPLGLVPDDSNWMLDWPAFVDLIEHIQGRMTSKTTQAPKITTFEHGIVLIRTGLDWLPTGMPISGDAEGHRSIKKNEEGINLGLAGSILDLGTQVQVTLDMTVAGQPGPAGVRQGPVSIVRHVEGGVPDGSSLLLSAGYHTRTIAGRPVRLERLVAVTPRRILLEPERPRPPADGTKPGL